MRKLMTISILAMIFFGCNNANKKEKESTVIQENESGNIAVTSEQYAERGLEYALSTKAVLGKNLTQTIQEKGIMEALAFCNVNAYPLTDSMAVVHHATIKRVSDKPRNLANHANAEELRYIDTYKRSIANQEVPKPIVKEINDKVHVYYPIVTNQMCLQCHGKPNETITIEMMKTLSFLYPKDKAIGYEDNEVRGIWSVTFEK